MCQQHIAASLDPASLSVVVDRVQAIASGFGVSDTPAAYEVAAAEQLAKISKPLVLMPNLAVVISCCLSWSGLWAKKRVSTAIPRT